MKKILFVADAFAEQYVGGAELTTDAIISYNKCNQITKINCHQLSKDIIQEFQSVP